MDPFSLPPVAALLEAAVTIILGLSDLLEPVAGHAAAAAAIALLTLLVRIVLIPTGVAQAKAEQARTRLAPRLRELAERHRRDPERLQRETTRLYADAGTSPLAGCLPMLVQAPVVGVLYAVFLHATIGGHANPLLAHELLGIPLGSNALHAVAGGDPGAIAVFGVLVLLIALVAEVTRRVFRPVASPEGPGSSLARHVGFLQYVTAAVAVFVPLAAGVYLLTTTTWTLAQRRVLRARYPLDGAR